MSDLIDTKPNHDGATFNRALDLDRLSAQTLGEIGAVTGDREQSVSARLRDLRKPAFGAFQIDRRRRGEPSLGLFEYRLVFPTPSQESSS